MLRSTVLLLLAVVACLTLTASALGASFTSTPAPYNRSGVGPFSFGFAPDSPGADGEYNATAHKFSSEATWHVCTTERSASFSSLPDGVYSMSIADDINLNWASSHGLLYSGLTQHCHDDPPPAPDPGTITTFQFVVDGKSPTLSQPLVFTDGKQVQVSVQAADDLSGIDYFRFTMGDGAATDSNSGSVRYSYLAYGMYHGTVTAYDKAGNATAGDFDIQLNAPLPGPAPSPPTPPRLPIRLVSDRFLHGSLRLVLRVPPSVTRRIKVAATLMVASRKITRTALARRPSVGTLKATLHFPRAARAWHRGRVVVSYPGDTSYAATTSSLVLKR